LARQDAWLFETALNACRYLPKPSTKTKRMIVDQILSIRHVELLAHSGEIRRLLALSEGLRGTGRLISLCASELHISLLASVGLVLFVIFEGMFVSWLPAIMLTFIVVLGIYVLMYGVVLNLTRMGIYKTITRDENQASYVIISYQIIARGCFVFIVLVGLATFGEDVRRLYLIHPYLRYVW
jgi:hypothetical protein